MLPQANELWAKDLILRRYWKNKRADRSYWLRPARLFFLVFLF